MQSKEMTVANYLKSLPAERAVVIKTLRKIINDNLPHGYKEVMRWGMISWEIPLRKYPQTYNGQPLNYIALAAQKNSYSLYLMACYSTDKDLAEFEKAYKATGKKLDIGKSCVRFKNLKDLPLDLIKKYVKKYSVNDFINIYERSKSSSKSQSIPYKEKYSNGMLKAVGCYKLGKLHGKWKWYRKNGVIMRSGQFKDGKQIGEWITYDSQGKPYKITKF